MGDSIKVRDTKTGRRYTIHYEGNPPSAEEIADIFNEKAGRSDIQDGLTRAYAPKLPAPSLKPPHAATRPVKATKTTAPRTGRKSQFAHLTPAPATYSKDLSEPSSGAIMSTIASALAAPIGGAAAGAALLTKASPMAAKLIVPAVGALGAGVAANKARDTFLEASPVGRADVRRERDSQARMRQENPLMGVAFENLPGLLTGRPSFIASAGERLVGGAFGLGQEGYSQYQEGKFNGPSLTLSTLLGSVLAGPSTRTGRAAEAIGAAGGRKVAQAGASVKASRQPAGRTPQQAQQAMDTVRRANRVDSRPTVPGTIFKARPTVEVSNTPDRGIVESGVEQDAFTTGNTESGGDGRSVSGAGRTAAEGNGNPRETATGTGQPDQATATQKIGLPTYLVAPEQVGILPGMQYKRGIDKEGVTDLLKGQQDYETEHGGTLTVYRDEAGNLLAVDGHHRRELAQRAKRFTAPTAGGKRVEVPRELPVQVLESSEGWTPESAKAFGVLKNLRENKGVSIDAADALLAGMSADEARSETVRLPKSQLSRDVSGLVLLDEAGRTAVRNRQIPDSVGAAIGEVLRGDLQRQRVAIEQAMHTAGVRSYEDGAALARAVKDEEIVARPQGEQGSMFGDDESIGGTQFQSTAGEQAVLTQSVKRRLQNEQSSLLSVEKTEAREGESFDVKGRREEAGQVREARSKADALLEFDPEVKATLRQAAADVLNGKISRDEGVKRVREVILKNGSVSLAEIVRKGTQNTQETIPEPSGGGLFAEPDPVTTTSTPKAVEATNQQKSPETLITPPVVDAIVKSATTEPPSPVKETPESLTRPDEPVKETVKPEPVEPEAPKPADTAKPQTPATPDTTKPGAQLLTIEVQSQIAKDLAAAGVNVADWTERGDLKHTFEDRFKAAAENYDTLSTLVRTKSQEESPGILSEEESIVAAKLQGEAGKRVRELLSKESRTAEEEDALTAAIVDVHDFGRLLSRSVSQAGSALGFARALFDDGPGGLIRAVSLAEGVNGTPLSPQAQRELMALAARGEAVREQVDSAREAKAEAEVEAYKAASPNRSRRRVSDPTKKGYGNDNTLFTREKYEAALATLKGNPTRRGATLPSLLLSADELAALRDMGGFHFEAGLRKFGAWAKQVKADMGRDVSDSVLQSTWLDVRAEAAEGRTPSTPPPRPSVFVEVLESRLGRDNARGFLDAIAEADGEPVLLQKLIDGEAISKEERKRIADAYRANSPARKRGVVTPEGQALASILVEFRKKSGYKPKPQTDAEARKKADERLQGIATTGRATAFKPRRVNPLISVATAEYAKGARSLDAWARSVENTIGESLPEDMKKQLFRDAVQEYMKEQKPFDEIKAQLTKRIEAEILRTQSPLIRAAKKLQENNRKAQTLKATFDSSFFGRQGGKIVTARPDIGVKTLGSFFVSRLKDKQSMEDWSRSVDARVLSTAGEFGDKDHFKNIGLEFTQSGQEEGTSGVNLDGPIWSRLRKMGIDASESGNRGILNYLRLEYFKTLCRPDDPIEYQQAMANTINIMSSRGMVKGEKLRRVLNVMADSGVWSPRNNISNVQWITGADIGATLLDAAKVSSLDPKAAQKKAAYRRALTRQLGERARYVVTYSLMMGMIKALADSQVDDGEELKVDLNPRSKDFGKIRYGRNEYDTLAGARKHVAFASEFLGLRQPSEFDLKPGESGGTWKKQTLSSQFGLIGKYGRSMVNPMVGNIIDIMWGEDFKGSPVKVSGLQDGSPFFDSKEAAFRAAMSVTPILVSAWAEALKEQNLSPDQARAILQSMPLDYMGIGASIRDRQSEPMKRARDKERGAGFVPPIFTLSALLSGKELPTVKPGREASTLELKARVLDAMVTRIGVDPNSPQGKSARRRISTKLSGASVESLRGTARGLGIE